MKFWLSGLWRWQDENKAGISLVIQIIGALCLVFHFATFAGLLFNYVAPIGVVSAIDNDSAFGIETAEKTWLINHNGSSMYGPVYYRVGAVFRSLFSNTYSDAASSPSQHGERSVFFHMTLINLIALYAGAFLLVWCLTDAFFFQCLGTVVLVSFILRNEWRALMLFTVKPEHLFAALMTGAGYLTLRWLASTQSPADRTNKEASLKWMSFGWATAASTKLSVLFCGPGLLSLWFPWDAERRTSLWFFAKRVFILYLLIGFPQNLDVVGSVKYLLHQSSQTRLVTWRFLSEDWWPLLMRDLIAPAAALVLMAFWVPIRETRLLRLSRRSYLRFSIYLILSFAFLFSKEIPIPHQWYAFPLVNQTWLLLAFTVVEASLWVGSRLDHIWRWKRHVLYPFAVMAVAPFALEVFPSNVFETYQRGLVCRRDIRAAQEEMDRMALAGRRILTDPYVPVDFAISRRLRTVQGSWSLSWAEVADFHPDFLAFKESYGRGILEDPLLASTTREFYQSFLSTDSLIDPRGNHWRRIYRNECGYSIWERF